VSTANLLVNPPGDQAGAAAWSFDHAQAHQQLLIAMAPLTQFSTVPYLLDPDAGMSQQGGMWQTLHQQAHQDFIDALPSSYGSEARGLQTSQILLSLDVTDPGQQAWWTFANHQEHYLANQTILPLGEAYPSPY
jgi:hypothetical protein